MPVSGDPTGRPSASAAWRSTPHLSRARASARCRRSRTSGRLPSPLTVLCQRTCRSLQASLHLHKRRHLSLQYENDDLMLESFGDDYASRAASRRCAGKQMQYFGARVNLAKCLLYAINGGATR